MKNSLWTLLLIFTFLSCGSDDDPGTQDSSEDFFECVIDGEPYRIEGTYAFATLIDTDLFGIYGNETPVQSGNYKNVYISLPMEPTTGTIELTDPEDSALGVILDLGTSSTWISTFGGSGEITITEKRSDRIKGTFSYTCVNLDDNTTRVVEDGKFDVKIMN